MLYGEVAKNLSPEHAVATKCVILVTIAKKPASVNKNIHALITKEIVEIKHLKVMCNINILDLCVCVCVFVCVGLYIYIKL